MIFAVRHVIWLLTQCFKLIRFWATVCKTVHPMPSVRSVCLSCLSCLAVCLHVCDVGVLWPNGWLDEDAAWVGSRPQPRPHCTRRGPSCRERGTAAHLFLIHVHCGHGRPSHLLLRSCCFLRSTDVCRVIVADVLMCLLAHISVMHSIDRVK